MSLDPYLDWAAPAALGALDGDEARHFASHAAGCFACQREHAEFARVAALVPLGLDAVPASPALRARVLTSLTDSPVPAVLAGPQRARAPRARDVGPRRFLVALAACVLLALGLGAAVVQRNLARRQAVEAQALVQMWRARADLSDAERTRLQAALHSEQRLRALLGQAEARVARLEGRPVAPRAHARVVWSPTSRQALLIADGLAQAPVGRTYQLWVIADAAPTPAGTFDVDGAGRALVATHDVEATARVRTFAVTLEPSGGRPLPSGPMVLAGNVS